MQRRHLAGIESALKFLCLFFLFRAINLSALDPFAQRSLD